MLKKILKRAASVCAAGLLMLSSFSPYSYHSTAADDFRSRADQVIYLVNEQRAANGLNPLYAAPVLMQVAEVRAKELEVKFSHKRPDGSSCFTLLDEYNIPHMAAAENIGSDSVGTPEFVVNMWMNSTNHRNNILNADYAYIGVGLYQGTDGAYYWVQSFTGGVALDGTYLPESIDVKNAALGDLNDDGHVNTTDAALLLAAAAAIGVGKEPELTAEQLTAADVNKDGAVNALDAASILRYAAYTGAGGLDSFYQWLGYAAVG